MHCTTALNSTQNQYRQYINKVQKPFFKVHYVALNKKRQNQSKTYIKGEKIHFLERPPIKASKTKKKHQNEDLVIYIGINYYQN